MEHVVVVGAGVTGLFLAVGLGRRGYRVTVVDRDSGPSATGWKRRGVMQFHHPHGIRQQAIDALDAEMPDVHEALLAVGAVDVVTGGLLCRRSTFERALRSAAAAEPGVTLLTGNVGDDVPRGGGRATGVLVDGQPLAADLVLDAGGRNSRIGAELRPDTEDQDCGLAYVSRQHVLLPGATPGPMSSGLGYLQQHRGYLVAAFLQDAATFSTLIARDSSDDDLAGLRHAPGYEAACAAIPALAAWTDPERSRPTSAPMVGANLHNTYRGQGTLPGLIHVGDAVCVTNPTVGRGIATSLMQARSLLTALSEHDDLRDACASFDAYCESAIRPWFDDHISTDPDRLARYRGADVDLDRPLTSVWIAEAMPAVAADLRPVIGRFLAMRTLPAELATIEPAAKAIYRGGWRPDRPAGPGHTDLAELIKAAEDTRPRRDG
ncbi:MULTISPECIES: FAD-dependent oxidoreductase [Catenuloplanes]|uniref:2-polyprenyl-6-methoxyphenol hydroxylase-like FAD-dependent oxidoreductase n=1 Tax=Catenuloplanes niger TaxID=587534 RepID=A0AAE4CV43_9ACTN|nr:FAD-dependent oxidoreductase [Catenuloplanes niger]MDR7325840.1 2-polyprenyl-6-methoxyphenol hydroxylase-like FAD-dependent oxidoreductase [Catenuloplanes niger]